MAVRTLVWVHGEKQTGQGARSLRLAIALSMTSPSVSWNSCPRSFADAIVAKARLADDNGAGDSHSANQGTLMNAPVTTCFVKLSVLSFTTVNKII